MFFQVKLGHKNEQDHEHEQRAYSCGIGIYIQTYLIFMNYPKTIYFASNPHKWWIFNGLLENFIIEIYNLISPFRIQIIVLL